MDVRGVEVGIVTADGARLAKFYVDGLRFTIDTELSFPRGTVRRLSRGPARCKIFEPAETCAPKPHREPWYSHGGIGYGALLVADAEAEVERACAHGATLVEGVIAHRPGARYAMITDPDGNVWELLQED